MNKVGEHSDGEGLRAKINEIVEHINSINSISYEHKRMLRCPHCDGVPMAGVMGKNTTYYVACESCYAQSARFEVLDDAIDSWNKRVC